MLFPGAIWVSLHQPRFTSFVMCITHLPPITNLTANIDHVKTKKKWSRISTESEGPKDAGITAKNPRLSGRASREGRSALQERPDPERTSSRGAKAERAARKNQQPGGKDEEQGGPPERTSSRAAKQNHFLAVWQTSFSPQDFSLKTKSREGRPKEPAAGRQNKNIFSPVDRLALLHKIFL